jgi:hypothetical protein
MFIGIIYDVYTGENWYRIEKDIGSLKTALLSIKLPLPTAGVFDSLENDFIEFNNAYKWHRTEMLEKARSIYNEYILKYPLEPRLLFRKMRYRSGIKEAF